MGDPSQITFASPEDAQWGTRLQEILSDPNRPLGRQVIAMASTPSPVTGATTDPAVLIAGMMQEYPQALQVRQQNPAQAQLLGMIPMVGGLLNLLSNFFPAIGDYFSAAVIKVTQGVDMAEARKMVANEKRLNNTIAHLQKKGLLPQGQLSDADRGSLMALMTAPELPPAPAPAPTPAPAPPAPPVAQRAQFSEVATLGASSPTSATGIDRSTAKLSLIQQNPADNKFTLPYSGAGGILILSKAVALEVKREGGTEKKMLTVNLLGTKVGTEFHVTHLVFQPAGAAPDPDNGIAIPLTAAQQNDLKTTFDGQDAKFEQPFKDRIAGIANQVLNASNRDAVLNSLTMNPLTAAVPPVPPVVPIRVEVKGNAGDEDLPVAAGAVTQNPLTLATTTNGASGSTDWISLKVKKGATEKDANVYVSGTIANDKFQATHITFMHSDGSEQKVALNDTEKAGFVGKVAGGKVTFDNDFKNLVAARTQKVLERVDANVSFNSLAMGGITGGNQVDPLSYEQGAGGNTRLPQLGAILGFNPTV